MSLANQTLGATDTTIFTCANASGSAVVGLIFCNTGASERTITVNARPAGEAVAAENRILSALAIPAGETYVFSDKLLLANTDVVSGLASVAAEVVVTVSYMNL
jgi:hypothetical protein